MVFGKLLPKETSFFDFFEQHGELTLEGAKEFLSLVQTAANIGPKTKRIKEIEHETDVITHRCVEALHRTFITPIERDDIHRLITRLDDIMDFVEAAADRILLYEVKEMTPEAINLADVLVRQVDAVLGALRGLRNLKHAEDVLKKCVDINRKENEADTILRAALARLFKEEKDAFVVIKWKEIYENIENATDSCEDVANTIEGIVLENA